MIPKIERLVSQRIQSNENANTLRSLLSYRAQRIKQNSFLKKSAPYTLRFRQAEIKTKNIYQLFKDLKNHLKEQIKCHKSHNKNKQKRCYTSQSLIVKKINFRPQIIKMKTQTKQKLKTQRNNTPELKKKMYKTFHSEIINKHKIKKSNDLEEIFHPIGNVVSTSKSNPKISQISQKKVSKKQSIIHYTTENNFNQQKINIYDGNNSNIKHLIKKLQKSKRKYMPNALNMHLDKGITFKAMNIQTNFRQSINDKLQPWI